MAGEIQLNSTTMATESSGSITAELDTIRPNTTNGSLTLQGDSSNAGVTGLTIDSSGVVNTTTAKVTNIQATSGQSLTIKNEDGNAAITIGTDNTAAGYLSLNFGSYHGDSGGAGSGTLTGNTLDDFEIGTWTLSNGNFTTFTSVTATAKYIKIGNLVFVYLKQTAGTIDPGGSTKYLVGLPFVPDSGGGSGSWSDGSVTINATGLITVTGVQGRIWTPVDFGSTSDLYFSGSYYTS
jgi:hypothetical protein